MIVYLDIETIGTESPEVIADLAATVTHPRTMSKPETIAKWEAEEKPALVDELVRKTSFDGGLGRIVCIGLAFDDAAPSVYYEGSESAILCNAFDAIRGQNRLNYHGGKTDKPMTFCGHNISGFDLRFLWQRAVCNRIEPPSCIPFRAKPWDSTIADTMLMWNPERERKVSLDRLCKILGVESPKGELDGSKVWEYVKAGKIAEVAEYCARDVAAVRECHSRMTFRA